MSTPHQISPHFLRGLSSLLCLIATSAVSAAENAKAAPGFREIVWRSKLRD
jgi:hypothetical protein